MPILAAALVFAFVVVLVLAFVGGESAARARLEAVRHRGPDRPSDRGPTAAQRIFKPAGEAVVGQVRRMLPTTILDGLQKRLVVAGEPTTVNGFLIMEVVCTAVFVGLPLLFVLVSAKTELLMLGMVLVFGAVGFVFPMFWLRQREGQRKSQIIKSLPDAFDLVTTCVEAGLGLDAALARVSQKVTGPFADELSRTLREISLGRMRREALRELADRTDVPDLVTFVNAVIQAEQMGSSLGAVLRVQSDQLRVKRRQRAEEQAYKAPVKMIFPLVLCIFPTLFIVILGPAVITIMNEFPGGK